MRASVDVMKHGNQLNYASNVPAPLREQVGGRAGLCLTSGPGAAIWFQIRHMWDSRCIRRL